MFRECCNMTKVHLHNALEMFTQKDMPGPLYAANFARITREAGVDDRSAKR